jgi:hypothetical protein
MKVKFHHFHSVLHRDGSKGSSASFLPVEMRNDSVAAGAFLMLAEVVKKMMTVGTAVAMMVVTSSSVVVMAG